MCAISYDRFKTACFSLVQILLDDKKADPFLGYSSRTYRFQHTIYPRHEHILDRRLVLKIVSCIDFHPASFHSIHRYHAPTFHFLPISLKNFKFQVQKFFLPIVSEKLSIFEISLGIIFSIGTKNIHVSLIWSVLVFLTVMIMASKTILLVSSQKITWLKWNINSFDVATSGRCGAHSKKSCEDY